MQNNFQKNSIINLNPGEKLDSKISADLTLINASKLSQPEYIKAIENLFGLQPITSFSEEDKGYLAGFIEGEGSMNVSLKKLKTATFGLLVDPEFSVTQHINGISNLHAIMSILKAGRIRYKAGSNATMSLIIDNRRSILERVLPFVKKYRPSFASTKKVERSKNMEKLLILLEAKGHLDFNTFCNQILPIWSEMRMQAGQSNESFPSLADAQKFAEDFLREKLKGKS